MENRFKKARTIHNQHGAQSTREVEKATGITKSLIEDIESTAGKPRNVGYLTVKKLAQYYGVSSDYLLGLSKTPSIEENIQAVCETTGLSENAVELLKHECALNPLYMRMDAINFLLENKYFRLLLDMIIGVATSKGEESSFTVESNGFAPIITDTDIFHAKAIDLFGSVLSDSKEYFSGKEDLRAFYGLYYYAYKRGSSLDAIKEELEKQQATFDIKMFTTKKRDEEKNNGEY